MVENKKRPLVVPMHPRSPDEAHRASTPLELFFDLVFVVAIALAASELHHAIVEGHIVEGIVGYISVFFAIWWAWMNFTWFASAYDTDDVPYRLAVFVKLTGALILAAGVPQGFQEQNFTIATIGYVIMRLPMVAQWLRAAQADPPRRSSAYRYAIGIIVCQTGWVALLFVPSAWLWLGFGILIAAELLVPAWAERHANTTWHPEHIAERYGLFTIIVLGESILAASTAIQALIESGDFTNNLITTIIGGLLIVFSMWWLYFNQPTYNLFKSTRTTFIWGYGHLPIFASAAAVGAGLGVVIDFATHHAEISATQAGLTVTIPVVIYMMGLWLLHQGFQARGVAEKVLFPITAILILLTSMSSQVVLLTGLLLGLLLTIMLIIKD